MLEIPKLQNFMWLADERQGGKGVSLVCALFTFYSIWYRGKGDVKRLCTDVDVPEAITLFIKKRVCYISAFFSICMSVNKDSSSTCLQDCVCKTLGLCTSTKCGDKMDVSLYYHIGSLYFRNYINPLHSCSIHSE